jgi:hypothetical protein
MAGFQKGQSGNPGGRTKAHRELARYIREKTQDGKGLADVRMAIARGEPMLRLKRKDGARVVQWGGAIPADHELVEEIWPDIDDVQDASDWLADRGVGKPVQAVELRVDETPAEAEAPVDWAKVPIEERMRLLEALGVLDGIATPAENDEAVEH